VAKTVYTIGTSTRKLKEFAETLKFCGIKRLIDVRHFPTSRFPHFKRERLVRSMPGNNMDYFYLGYMLGGFIPKGYEAYSKGGEFKEGVTVLERLAGEKLSAFVCAGRLFWRCHRRF
jgi:uncharacterized protein (DUF488 family)